MGQTQMSLQDYTERRWVSSMRTLILKLSVGRLLRHHLHKEFSESIKEGKDEVVGSGVSIARLL